jgi:hypothetical protein
LERRLAAILAADVVGYSRLMGEDEAGTLDRLKSLRRELVQPKITERKGRIVKLMGDGLLAEFPSVVEAVLCAINIQQEVAEREPDISDDPSRALTFTVTASTWPRGWKLSPTPAACAFPGRPSTRFTESSMRPSKTLASRR